MKVSYEYRVVQRDDTYIINRVKFVKSKPVEASPAIFAGMDLDHIKLELSLAIKSLDHKILANI